MGKYSTLKIPVKNRATPLFLMKFFKHYACLERELSPKLVADNFLDN